MREELAKKKLNAFLAQVRDFTKRAAIESVIKEHTIVLQYPSKQYKRVLFLLIVIKYASSMAIASLFLGPAFVDQPTVKDPTGIAFAWINKMMMRNKEKV